MHSIKWLLVLDLYATALLAAAAGHSNLAIAVAIAAAVATLAALEVGLEPDVDDGHGLAVDRLELVLEYAWQLRLGARRSTDPSYLLACRLGALGLAKLADRG